MEKWPIFEQNHGLTPLEKCHFFDSLKFFFYCVEMYFFVLEYHKPHFPGLYCFKKNDGKMANFEQNHGLTPLEKCHFFDSLKFFFYCVEMYFFVLEYHKPHFPGLYCLKKEKMEKWPIFEQDHGLTPLQKCQFFDFLNFLFILPRNALFRSRIS